MIQIWIDMEMPKTCPKCKFYKDQNDAEYCIITGHRFTGSASSVTVTYAVIGGYNQ